MATERAAGDAARCATAQGRVPAVGEHVDIDGLQVLEQHRVDLGDERRGNVPAGDEEGLDLAAAQPQRHHGRDDRDEQEEQRRQRAAAAEVLHAGALVAEGEAIEVEAEHVGRPAGEAGVKT